MQELTAYSLGYTVGDSSPSEETYHEVLPVGSSLPAEASEIRDTGDGEVERINIVVRKRELTLLSAVVISESALKSSPLSEPTVGELEIRMSVDLEGVLAVTITEPRASTVRAELELAP